LLVIRKSIIHIKIKAEGRNKSQKLFFLKSFSPQEVLIMKTKTIRNNKDDINIIGIFCIVDDVLKNLGLKDDVRAKASNSEILTIAILVFLFFGGNFKKALSFVLQHNLFTKISYSRFLRRLRDLVNNWGHTLFFAFLRIFDELLQQKTGKEYNEKNKTFIIDSKIIKACENVRISRCKKFQGEEFRGYIASKREYAYGVKLHVLCDKYGIIREYAISPASDHDIKGLYFLPLNLPSGSQIIGDKAYNSRFYEELLKQEGIELRPIRKRNMKKEGWIEELSKRVRRKVVETVLSVLEKVMGIRIHAVTVCGFIMKIVLAIISYNLYRFFKIL
jgi:IS5 family transposase